MLIAQYPCKKGHAPKIQGKFTYGLTKVSIIILSLVWTGHAYQEARSNKILDAAGNEFLQSFDQDVANRGVLLYSF